MDLKKELEQKEKEFKTLANVYNQAIDKVDQIKNIVAQTTGQIALLKRLIEEEKPKETKKDKK